MFTKKINEYNGNQQEVLVGLAKLVSPINESWQSYTNGEGNTKRYKLVTIGIDLPSGKTTTMTAQIHEKNLELIAEAGNEFKVGDNYLTTLRRVESTTNPGQMITFAQMSHLQGAVNDEAALDELFASVEEGAEVAAQA